MWNIWSFQRILTVYCLIFKSMTPTTTVQQVSMETIGGYSFIICISVVWSLSLSLLHFPWALCPDEQQNRNSFKPAVWRRRIWTKTKQSFRKLSSEPEHVPDLFSETLHMSNPDPVCGLLWSTELLNQQIAGQRSEVRAGSICSWPGSMRFQSETDVWHDRASDPQLSTWWGSAEIWGTE